MKVLVFDTETTGLPLTKLLRCDLLPLWPHIVQFSYIIYDIEREKVLKIHDNILKIPDDILMTEEAINVHHITNEMSQQSITTFEVILNEFFNDLHSVDELVAHNLDFDMNMIKVELMRIVCQYSMNLEEKRRSSRLQGFSPSATVLKTLAQEILKILDKKTTYCTMQNSIQLCNIKTVSKTGKAFTKYPKLKELHEKLFAVAPLENLHNSLNDAVVCLRCYLKLKHEMNVPVTLAVKYKCC